MYNGTIKKIKSLERYLEWPFRLLLTITVCYSVLKMGCEDHYYPEVALGFILLALWFYFFKIKLVAVCILFFDLFIIYQHPAY